MKRFKFISIILILWSAATAAAVQTFDQESLDQGCSEIDLNIKHGRFQVLHGALRFKCNEGFSLNPKSLRTLKCADLKLPSVVLPRCLPTRPPNDEPRLEGGEDYEGKVIDIRYQALNISRQ